MDLFVWVLRPAWGHVRMSHDNSNDGLMNTGILLGQADSIFIAHAHPLPLPTQLECNAMF